MNVNNQLAKNNPIEESILIENTKKFLGGDPSQLEDGISKFIEILTSKAQGYKFIVNVVQLQSPAGATCVSGAHWDAQQDGTWVYDHGRSFVTVSWVKV